MVPRLVPEMLASVASRTVEEKVIDRATLARVDRTTTSGRTRPVVAQCSSVDGDVEIVLKPSKGCELGEASLAREAVAALLASDLGQPAPQPWLVDMPEEAIAAVQDPQIADRLRCSSKVAFGSTFQTGFGIWQPDQQITESMMPLAAEILLFDAIIQNPDRRVGNPNCLLMNDELRIIDHEMAFSHHQVILWKPPWIPEGLKHIGNPGFHVFVGHLKGVRIDFSQAKDRWESLTDSRLQEYKEAVPDEWSAAGSDVDAAVALIAEARDNIDSCIGELRGILK